MKDLDQWNVEQDAQRMQEETEHRKEVAAHVKRLYADILHLTDTNPNKEAWEVAEEVPERVYLAAAEWAMTSLPVELTEYTAVTGRTGSMVVMIVRVFQKIANNEFHHLSFTFTPPAT